MISLVIYLIRFNCIDVHMQLFGGSTYKGNTVCRKKIYTFVDGGGRNQYTYAKKILHIKDFAHLFVVSHT